MSTLSSQPTSSLLTPQKTPAWLNLIVDSRVSRSAFSANGIAILFAVLFFLSGGWNAFRIADYEAWRWFQADSQSLVEVRLLEVEKGVSVWQGGSLRQNIPFFENRPVSDLQAIDRAVTKPYTSQFGLQGLIIASFAQTTGLTAEKAGRLAELGIAALTAFALAFFIRWIGRELSVPAAVFTAVGIFFAPFPICIARNLYWVPFTFFLPLIPACLAASKIGWTKELGIISILRSRWVWLGIPALVFIKCLCGYEYLTNLILGCAIPFLYIGLREGVPFWKKLVPQCAVICAIACLGFFAALAVHLWFISSVVLPDGGGLEAVMNRVAANTVASKHPLFQEFQGLKLYFILVLKYLINDAVDIGIKIGFGRGDFYFLKTTYQGMIGLLGFVFAGAFFLGVERDKRLRATLYTALLAWVLSFSWLFLAKGHQHHFHLNNWMFWLYAMPFTFASLGQFFSFIRKKSSS